LVLCCGSRGDFIRLVETRPEWRAELRRLVLTDELLSLPAQVATLTDRIVTLAEAQQRTEVQVATLTTQVATLTDRIVTLAEAQQRTEAQVTMMTDRIATLAEAQQRTETQVATLARTMQTLTDDVGTLKGKSLEADYRAKGHAYFSRVVRHPHVLTSDEIVTLVEGAQDRGVFSADETQVLYAADVIVHGRCPADGTEVYLVVEVSWSVDPHDVERAVQRAALLARMAVAVIPVVAGARLTAEAGRLAHQHQVWQLTDGHTIPPA